MKVSVITTVRNGAATLATCLESVAFQLRRSPRGQEFEIEHVVVDGLSTDGSVELARAYPATVRQLVSEPDRGIYDGMNKGLALATGEVAGFLNADDFFFRPDALGQVVDVFSGDTDTCYGQVLGVDPGRPERIRRVWPAVPYRRSRFRFGWMPPHPTFFARLEAYRRFGFLRLDLGSAADYELMLRFLYRHRLSSRCVPDLWIAMRLGGVSNATFGNRLRSNSFDRKAWKVNGLDPFPGFRILKPARKVPQFWRRPSRLVERDLVSFLHRTLSPSFPAVPGSGSAGQSSG